MASFLVVDFAVTTHGGADFSTSEELVTLEGVGWIDVQEIWAGSSSLDVIWSDAGTWQVQVPLVEGSQRIALETVSLADEVVGADSLTITRSP